MNALFSNVYIFFKLNLKLGKLELTLLLLLLNVRRGIEKNGVEYFSESRLKFQYCDNPVCNIVSICN